MDSGNNRAVEIRPSGVQTTLTSELNQAFGIAVDGAGNVFIADTNNNRIVEVPFGKAQVVVPVSGLYLPSDVDAAGDLFIADHGNSRVVEWSAAGVQTIVPTNGVSFPIGLALDGAGDLFVTDDVANLAVELPRSQPPAFHFVNTVAGTTSSDSPLSATVENIGNQPLNAIAPGLSISKASGDTVFAQVAGTGTPADCTTAFSLAPGSSCNLSISFTATEDNVYRGSAVLTDNSLNANPATQSILLTGLGTTVGTLLTLTIPDQTYGVAPFALNATSNSPAAIIYSVLSGPATISGNVLTITGTGHVTVQASQSAQTGYTGSVTRPGFTVNPVPLTVTANSTRRASGAANPTFTYTITGFVNGDTSSVVSGTATLTTVATSATPPGTYPITFSAEGLTAANYTFNYVNGSLIIGTQTIGLTPAVTANPATITIASSGGSGSTVLTVANFAGSSVTFTCTGLPAEASCNPGPLSSSNTATLQITTTAPSAALSMPPNRNGSAKTVYAVALPGLLAIGGLFATRRRQWRQLFVLLLLLSAGMAMTACGGSTNNTGTSGNPGNPSGPSDPGTPAATSTVTVTATDGAQTASVPITLVVQ
ncbi:MAG: MBG domain-containing protein [Edaphobacter sp.]